MLLQEVLWTSHGDALKTPFKPFTPTIPGLSNPLGAPTQYAQRCPTGEELAAQKASSYVFRAKIDGKYFDQLDSWCLKNPTVTKNISNGLYGFSGSNKINFENKSNTLRLLINSVDGDFDISTDGLVGHTAHHTRESHNNFLLLLIHCCL